MTELTAFFVHDGSGVVPAADARVPLLDHGFLFGDSVYDVVRSIGPRLHECTEHFARLRRSAAQLYLALPWTDADLRARIAAVHERLGPVDAMFRIVATRGPGPYGLSPAGCDAPGLYILGGPLPRLPAALYEKGCALHLVTRLRNDVRALDPSAKTGNYLNNMLGLVEARRAGADDALFCNASGQVTEATTANVWVVRDGAVVTPALAAGLLPGVTRAWLLSALAAAGIPASEAAVTPADCAAADEMFLTGTVKGVLPVRALNGQPIGTGAPGPLTRRAAELYSASLARESR